MQQPVGWLVEPSVISRTTFVTSGLFNNGTIHNNGEQLSLLLETHWEASTEVVLSGTEGPDLVPNVLRY